MVNTPAMNKCIIRHDWWSSPTGDSSLLDAKMFTMERAVYAELHHKSPVKVGQAWNYSIGFDAGRLVRIKPKKITFTDGWLAAFRVSPHGLPRMIQGRQTRSYIRGFNTGYDAS